MDVAWTSVDVSRGVGSTVSPEDLLIVGASFSLFGQGEEAHAVLFASGEGLHVYDLRSFERLVVSYRERRGAETTTLSSSGVWRCGVDGAEPESDGAGSGVPSSSFRVAESLCCLLCNRRNTHDAVRIGPSEVFLDVSVSELLGAALFFHPSAMPGGQHLSLTVPAALGWVARAHLALALGMNGIGVRRINTTAAALAAALLATAEGRNLLLRHEGQVRLLVIEASSDYVGAALVQIEVVLSNLSNPLSPALTPALPHVTSHPQTSVPLDSSSPFWQQDDPTCVSFAASGAKKSKKKKKKKRGERLSSPDDEGQDSSLLSAMQLSSISSTPLIRVESMCGSAVHGQDLHSGRLQDCIRAVLRGRGKSCTKIDSVVLWLDEAGQIEENTRATASKLSSLESDSRLIAEAELSPGGGEVSWLRLSRPAVELGSAVLATSRVYECECRKIGLRFIEKKFDGFISHVVWLSGLRSLDDVNIRVRAICSSPSIPSISGSFDFGVYHHASQCRDAGELLLMGTMKVPKHACCGLELQVVEDRSDGSTDDDSVGVILGLAWPEEETPQSEAEVRFNAQGLLSFHATFHSPSDGAVDEGPDLVVVRRRQVRLRRQPFLRLSAAELVLAVASLALLLALLALSPPQTGGDKDPVPAPVLDSQQRGEKAQTPPHHHHVLLNVGSMLQKNLRKLKTRLMNE